MRAIVSVIGKDKQGIIAKVSALLFERGINIEDISQTIMSEYFTMIMLVDVSKSKAPLAELAKQLEDEGREIGVTIHTQHEDLFNAMHKL